MELLPWFLRLSPATLQRKLISGLILGLALSVIHVARSDIMTRSEGWMYRQTQYIQTFALLLVFTTTEAMPSLLLMRHQTISLSLALFYHYPGTWLLKYLNSST